MAGLIADNVDALEMGVASGMNTVVRMIGAVIGGQVAAALLTAQTIGTTSIPAESAFTTTFALSAGAALVAAGIALSIGTHAAPQPARAGPTPARANVPGVDADAVEIRVLGCLIEKQRTTPDQYPLSLNALRLACNQATNRDPVVDYDDATIRAAIDKLSRRGWVRLASGPGGRVAKYRHLLDDALGRVPSQIALLGGADAARRADARRAEEPGRADLPVRLARGRPAGARRARRAKSSSSACRAGRGRARTGTSSYSAGAPPAAPSPSVRRSAKVSIRHKVRSRSASPGSRSRWRSCSVR